MNNDPYRQDGERPIFTQEAELAAIGELADRKSRLTRWMTVPLLILGLPLFFVAWQLSSAVQFRFLGVEFFILDGLVECGVLFALTLSFLNAVVPLIVRIRRDAWLRAASERHGIPVEELRWVFANPFARNRQR